MAIRIATPEDIKALMVFEKGIAYFVGSGSLEGALQAELDSIRSHVNEGLSLVEETDDIITGWLLGAEHSGYYVAEDMHLRYDDHKSPSSRATALVDAFTEKFGALSMNGEVEIDPSIKKRIS
jgi:hypothetical protein